MTDWFEDMSPCWFGENFFLGDTNIRFHRNYFELESEFKFNDMILLIEFIFIKKFKFELNLNI